MQVYHNVKSGDDIEVRFEDRNIRMIKIPFEGSIPSAELLSNNIMNNDGTIPMKYHADSTRFYCSTLFNPENTMGERKFPDGVYDAWIDDQLVFKVLLKTYGSLVSMSRVATPGMSLVKALDVRDGSLIKVSKLDNISISVTMEAI